MGGISIPLSQLSSQGQIAPVRAAAMLDLAQMEWPNTRCDEIREAVLTSLADPNEDFRVRLEAIRVIRGRGLACDRRTQALLLENVLRNDSEMRSAAWGVLVEEGFHGDDYRAVFRKALRSHEYYALEDLALLAAARPDCVQKVKHVLLLGLRHIDPDVQSTCLEAFAMMDRRSRTPRIESELVEFTRGAVGNQRISSLRALRALGIDIAGGYPDLLQGVDSVPDDEPKPSAHIPSNALSRALSELREAVIPGSRLEFPQQEQAIEEAEIALCASDSEANREICILLGRLLNQVRSSELRVRAGRLFTVLLNDPIEDVRVTALKVMRDLEAKVFGVREAVRNACGDVDPLVRQEAHKTWSVLENAWGEGEGVSALEYIDTHTHLCAEEFDADRNEVVARARDAGVVILVDIGSGYGRHTAYRSVKNAEAFSEVFAAVGLHPCDSAEKFDPAFLLELAQHPRVVGIGETGLDYYWMKAPKQDQERWFRAQIELALQVRKPLIIHSRDASEECLRILTESGAGAVGGVFHCFQGDVQFAARLRGIGFLVSVPGTLTFKKADQLREIFRDIPLEQIMLETDAPFLAPQRWRGKRCESSFLVETAGVLAAIKRISLEEVAAITTQSARRLFRL